MPRKKIVDMIAELRSWLPNYDHKDYPTTLFRILASLPGGEELEDMGYEPMPGISWHEADQLGRVLEAIQDKSDVEDLVAGLVREEEDVEEVRRAPAEVHGKGTGWYYLHISASPSGPFHTKGFPSAKAARDFIRAARWEPGTSYKLQGPDGTILERGPTPTRAPLREHPYPPSPRRPMPRRPR